MAELDGSALPAREGSEASNGTRIGVYVCHCGTNISGKVDVEEVARYAAALPNVVISRDYKFVCSDPGQDLIIKDIREHRLTRVVVSSCSPRMHEPTFRGACGRGDLNPFLMTMANIREHCSWVTVDPAAATDKAKALVRGAVCRVAHLAPLQVREVAVNPDVLVIGGGLAGIQASLQVADADRKVYLVEKEPSIGGHMAKFDKTFPTLDCAACILTPKMVSVGQHHNIKLLTYSEVVEVSGYVGNFKVRVRRKARMVDEEKCNGCGACWEMCPAAVTPQRKRVLLGKAPIRRDGLGPPERLAEGTQKADTGRVLEKLWSQFQKKREDEHNGEECTLCGLCVRMCRDVVGASALSIEKAAGDGNARKVVVEGPERCVECGACAAVCPTGYLRVVEEGARRDSSAAFHSSAQGVDGSDKIHHDQLMLGPNKAISIPFMQAVPAIPVINREHCIHFKTGGCKACVGLCERDAIDHNAQDEYVEVEVGSIIVTTGFQTFDPGPLEQYGYGRLKNVLTALEFEQLNNASGPTGGKILLADGRPPKSVALIHCVGSRDKNYHEYCSRVCCMAALKYAHLIHEKTQAEVYDFFIDLRCFGKGYEEFYNRLLEEGVFFIRGRAGEISDFAIYEEERGKLIVRCEDTLIGIVRRIPVDMVVLMTALEPAADSEAISRTLTLPRGKDGFFLEQHPKLAPVATATDGVFIAGACQGPKDIPDTVAQASAAAAASLTLSVRGRVVIEAVTCQVDSERCAGCRLCNAICPYSAIAFDCDAAVSVINDAVCKGCGTCAAACPSSAILARHFDDRQVLSEIAGVCS
jgi:heterodisulfide reductase subunit A-like polyferredoxin